MTNNAIVAAAAEQANNDGLRRFVTAYWHGIDAEDIEGRSAESILASARQHLELAQQLQSGAAVRVSEAEVADDQQVSAVEIVVDDMPFLVDSTRNALIAMGCQIQLMLHPVISLVEGKPQSFIRLELNPESAERESQIQEKLETVLADVASAVRDWKPMLAKASEVADAQDASEPEQQATQTFLRWLVDDHFAFLGYRRHTVKRDADGSVSMVAEDGSGLGVQQSASPWRDEQSGDTRCEQLIKYMETSDRLTVTKASAMATVHRHTRLDYIAVKECNAAGEMVAEHRFTGLFAQAVYNRSVRSIPLLVSKAEQVFERMQLAPSSYDGKRLTNLLETLPRDELFQCDVEQLADIAEGVLSIRERERLRVFAREDAFHRYWSCFIFISRDRYSRSLREKMQSHLQERIGGYDSDSDIHFSGSPLARIHCTIRVKGQVSIDWAELEQELSALAESWDDQLLAALQQGHSARAARGLLQSYANRFSAAYREQQSAGQALADIQCLQQLSEDNRDFTLKLYRSADDGADSELIHLRVFHDGGALPLSSTLPTLENMGLCISSESHWSLEAAEGEQDRDWAIQDFVMRATVPLAAELESLSDAFAEAFECVWQGRAEDDGFNKLVLAAGLQWRQVAVLRGYCKYLLQIKTPFSQPYMEQVLTGQPRAAKLLADLFVQRFDPSSTADRDAEQERLNVEFDELLNDTSSLDVERILLAFRHVLLATDRTNYYRSEGGQTDGELRPFISFKLDPARIPNLPKPRLAHEIWVYSPRFEAVHLRGGKVARGGLRWSDRREDFRTEILGLVKSQMVKNTVIVPLGAKGGFVCKQQKDNASRQEFLDEGIACYKGFMGGMLDLTDNLVDGNVVPPPSVVRHDDDDPYLVVAADKGTATFSDIANSVSREYGFWIDDAFASGGSNGYDHKVMGITARGAWESVKRHFREMGRDCQNEPFTVVGVGDMGGDVFGNGMLLSEQIKLVAAFNHLHIFIDPDPDPAKSFAERKRLFEDPRNAGWNQYSEELISKGGGVFERSAKSIPLSAELKTLIGRDEDSLSPNQLMQALLKADVDLFWNGGIGTYLKSSDESHAEVGDRANDDIRVNGDELGAKVIGEGGNLGATQLGRVEFARNGGRCNTDFIDNSAGVDSSDAEVNIKILLNPMVNAGQLTWEDRNTLLESMTDDVAVAVLRDNYLQSQTISMSERNAAFRLGEHVQLIRELERIGILDRALEYLPSDEDLTQLQGEGKGLTRPELAVLLSYSKMAVYQDLLDSDVLEDETLASELIKFFPEALQERYGEEIPQHKLRTEIIATRVTNSIVNRMGPSFPLRMRTETGASLAEVARAYTVAREIYGVGSIWWGIEQLDLKVDANVQLDMHTICARFLRQASHWALLHTNKDKTVGEAVQRFAPNVEKLRDQLHEILPEATAIELSERRQSWIDKGVGEELAERLSRLLLLYPALDCVLVAEQQNADVIEVAKCYFALGEQMQLHWLQQQVTALEVESSWHALSRNSLRDSLYRQQRQLTSAALKAWQSAADWSESQSDAIEYSQQLITDLHSRGPVNYLTLSVVVGELGKLVSSVG